jgi:phosphate transport system permease protein
LLPLFLVIKFVFSKGIASINWNFFLEMPKPVGEIGGGMAHAIVGTLYMVSVAGLIAIPVGLTCGIYLSEYGRGKLARTLRFCIDLLSGVPSIIVGIFTYALIVMPFRTFSSFAGGVALSIIMLPIIVKSTEEILKLVPDHIREAGLALGLPRWSVIYHIVFKGSLSGIVTGIVLSIARAGGETAPLLFTALSATHLSFNLTEPMASLPVQIYNYAISPFASWQEQAWAGSLVLIGLVLSLNLTAKAIVHRQALYPYLQKMLLVLGLGKRENQ